MFWFGTQSFGIKKPLKHGPFVRELQYCKLDIPPKLIIYEISAEYPAFQSGDEC
jgi:hypothetical protein